MRTLLALVFMILLFACKSSPEQSAVYMEATEEITYSFKVEGLNDSIVAESVGKIIFVFPGIEEIVVDKTDALISVKYKVETLEIDQIKEELEKRGVKILKVIK